MTICIYFDPRRLILRHMSVDSEAGVTSSTKAKFVWHTCFMFFRAFWNYQKKKKFDITPRYPEFEIYFLL